MTDEKPITLNDIIQMADAPDDLDLSSPVEPNGGAIKNTVSAKKHTSKQTSAPVAEKIEFNPKETAEEILTSVKKLPAGVKVKEENNQRIFERICERCHHIFFSDIPLRRFYVENKKGENYKVIKLPADQYPADLPQDILAIIESRQCHKCRKK